MELKGSRTEANLMAAFAGESQAKQVYYASKARKDGGEQIAAISGDRQQGRAREIWFKLLHGGRCRHHDQLQKMPRPARTTVDQE